MIGKITKENLLKIKQKEPYSPDYDECIKEAKKDKQMHARQKLLDLPDSIQRYDEIYLGYPN